MSKVVRKSASSPIRSTQKRGRELHRAATIAVPVESEIRLKKGGKRRAVELEPLPSNKSIRIQKEVERSSPECPVRLSLGQKIGHFALTRALI